MATDFEICPRCSQPITMYSTRGSSKNGWYHIGQEGPYAGSIGCPVGEGILKNLKIAMEQGFVPQFCRTHYQDDHAAILEQQNAGIQFFR